MRIGGTQLRIGGTPCAKYSNDEINYNFIPYFIDNNKLEIEENIAKEIDELARLMINPDENFTELVDVWNIKRKFRILNAPLIRTMDNSKILFEASGV